MNHQIFPFYWRINMIGKILCFFGKHKPDKIRVIGHFGPSGAPDINRPFEWIAQECSRCGQIMTVCWPPYTEEQLKDVHF